MISADTLAAVAAATAQGGGLAALRAAFPELHFSECSEDDVSPRYREAARAPGYVLYYITGATGHCLEMTNDPQIATGILVATQADDE